MKVTAKDIANKIGVSQATVSMVLNNKSGISDTVRKKILETAKQMGYSKKNYINKDSKIIQFIIFKRHGRIVSENPFMEFLIQGVSEKTSELGYHLAISYFYGDKNKDEQLKSIKSLQSEGIILLATEMRETDMQLFENFKTPLIMLDNFSSSMKWDSVVIDNQYGVIAAIKHLISCGHTRIGYLHSGVDIRNFRDRYRGYISGCTSLSEQDNKDAIKRIIKTDVIMEKTTRIMKDYLKLEPILPTAFFADNDYIAAGCCRALIELGYHVPEDVSIIGFDDSPIAKLMETPLTTMAVPKEKMGAMAVIRLCDRIKNKEMETIRISIMPRIIERGTVLDLNNFNKLR